MSKPAYKRVLLKLSGEALSGDKGFGINNEVVNDIANGIKKLREIDVEVAVVVGGGTSGEVELLKVWIEVLLIT